MLAPILGIATCLVYARTRCWLLRREPAVAFGVALSLLVMATGCAPPHAPEEAERWAKAWVESLNSHQLQQVTPLLDAAATYQDPTTGKPLSGAQLTFFLAGLWNHAPESRYELRSAYGNREVLAVEWSATGLGAATARRPLEGVFLIHFNGDRIRSVRAYYDTPATTSGAR